MSRNFEELDFQTTPMGELSLRRRRIPLLENREVFEIQLNNEFLMSSLFHEVEVALADLGLAGLPAPLDVLVGGLGLGYTAQAALRHETLRLLYVVEALETVIDWHKRGLVPLGSELSNDPRCHFVAGDFFALAADPEKGFVPDKTGARFHAILLDIDHSPHHHLHPSHSRFYQPADLRRLAQHLHPEGVFGMWSDEPPEEDFLSVLAEVFVHVRAEVVSFANPIRERDSASTVYLARK